MSQKILLDPRGLARPPGASEIPRPTPFLILDLLLDLLVTIDVFASRHIVQARSRQAQKLVRGLLPYF